MRFSDDAQFALRLINVPCCFLPTTDCVWQHNKLSSALYYYLLMHVL